jgi:hypothetical protein
LLEDFWLRGQDLNLRPSGYEPDELPGCSTPRWYFGWIGGPGGDLLSRALRHSTMGAGEFHGRVRDGIGCRLPAKATRSSNPPRWKLLICSRRLIRRQGWKVLAVCCVRSLGCGCFLSPWQMGCNSPVPTAGDRVFLRMISMHGVCFDIEPLGRLGPVS